MKSLLVLLLTLSASFLFGQNTRVIANIESEGIPEGMGRGMVFSLPDSNLVKGNFIDSTSISVRFNAKKGDEFFLRLVAPGLKDTGVVFTVEDTLVDLGTISLYNEQSLDEVSVVYREPYFEKTINGLKVNVKGTTLEELNTLFDILKASPRLNSPDDESIEIIGRGAPLILIDRQPIMTNDELKAIPADQVDRFEILTNPSAKYKAQGSGNGVIEVFTTNFELEGYRANIRMDGGVNTNLYPQIGGNVGLSFKKKKFSMSGYGGMYYYSTNSSGTGSGYSTTSDLNHLYSDEGDYNNLWRNYKLKMSYAFTDSSRLNFGVNGHGSSGGSEYITETNYFDADSLVTSRYRNNNGTHKWVNNSAFVNYNLDTDTLGSYFEVNANFTKRVSDYSTTNRNRFFANNTTTLNNIQTSSEDQPNVGELRVNYEHHFDTSEFKLELGASYSVLLNEKKFFRFTELNDTWVEDNSAQNTYNYQENIIGSFAQISKMLTKKMGAQVGLRAEHTILDGYSKTLDQQFMDSSYTSLFPNIGMLYNVSDNVSITAYYETGIDRPGFNNYDPFVRETDSLNITVGNPYLRPSYSHTFGAELELFYSYNLSFSYSKYDGERSTLEFTDPTNFVTTSTPWNGDYHEIYSVSVSVPIRAKWVNGWNSFWLDYNNYYFTDIFQRDTYSNINMGFYSYLTFDLPKEFQIMNRFSAYKWANDQRNGNFRHNWGIRLTKKFKKPDLNLYAEVSNLLPPKNKISTVTGNYNYESSEISNFTTFKLGFFYKFGRLKADPNIKESSSGQSDRL